MDIQRVRDAMEALLEANPEVADRDDLAEQVRTIRELRAWLDAYEVRAPNEVGRTTVRSD